MDELLEIRRLHLKRIIDWSRVHRVGLNVDSAPFMHYQAAYEQLPAAPYTGETFPFFILSTGHTGSVWTTFLCQLLDPDNMLCFHDHETVRAWVNFADQLSDPAKWSTWTATLRAARQDQTPAQLLDWLCPQLPPHLSGHLQAFNIVGYSLIADSGPWLGIMEAAASYHPAAKLALLIRDGILVVNSKIHFNSALMSHNSSGSDAANIDQHVLTETVRAHGVYKPPSFQRHVDDVFLGAETDLYNRCVVRYPNHEMFILTCYMWRVCNARLLEILDRVAPDKRIIIRLEDLTTNVGAVATFRDFLLGKSADDALFDAATGLAQSLVINRKVHDNTDSRSVWRSWNAAQRAIFADLCEPTQRRFSYEIP